MFLIEEKVGVFFTVEVRLGVEHVGKVETLRLIAAEGFERIVDIVFNHQIGIFQKDFAGLSQDMFVAIF